MNSYFLITNCIYFRNSYLFQKLWQHNIGWGYTVNRFNTHPRPPGNWTQFKGWCKKNCDVAPMSSLIITLSTFIFILSFNMYCLRLFTGLITLLTDIYPMCTTWIWIVSYPSLLLYNHTFHIEIIFFRHVYRLDICRKTFLLFANSAF